MSILCLLILIGLLGATLLIWRHVKEGRLIKHWIVPHVAKVAMLVLLTSYLLQVYNGLFLTSLDSAFMLCSMAFFALLLREVTTVTDTDIDGLYDMLQKCVQPSSKNRVGDG